MAGRFIVFEGIDSEVLTEQAADLSSWMRGEGLTVNLTREPTDGPFGAQLRLVLGGRLKVDDLTRAALFMTDRMDHLYRNGGVLSDLDKGYYVVGIRYLLSTYAYQGQELCTPDSRFKQTPTSGDALEWLRHINQQCRWPDLVLFLDSPVEGALRRAVEREGTEAVKEFPARYKDARRGYRVAIERCQQWGLEVKIIDGNQPTATIQRLCRQAVEALGLEK
ncbi:MAG: thymidylate kinase [Anaerolineae bacterium]|nr:thymidylate kinase [Anaerolineae bacterium]